MMSGQRSKNPYDMNHEILIVSGSGMMLSWLLVHNPSIWLGSLSSLTANNQTLELVTQKKKKANNFLERTWSQPPFGRLCFGTCSVCIMAKQIQVIVISMLFSCSHISSSHTVSREDRCQFGPMFRSHLPRRVCPLIQTDPDPHGHGMTAGWLGRLGHTPNIWRIWHIHTS